MRLADLLNHLYVLLPVLDDDKHYWVDEAEIEKLMRRGEGWLGGHPERDLIVRRYLKKQARLYFPALAQLDEAAPPAEEEPGEPGREERLEEDVSLRDRRRLGTVQSVLKASGARRVLDLGCGAGALLGEPGDLQREQLALARAELRHARECGARFLLALEAGAQVLDQLGAEQHPVAGAGADIETILPPLKTGQSISLMDRDRAQPPEQAGTPLGLLGKQLQPRERAGVLDQRVRTADAPPDDRSSLSWCRR